jgi:hypothetical protein
MEVVMKWKKQSNRSGIKNATGDDDVPADVLRLLGEDGFKLMTS